jgi:signal transduction histidine kinase
MSSTLASQIERTAPDVTVKIRAISAHIRAATDRAREIARGLSPQFKAEPRALVDALQRLAADTKRLFKRECRFNGSTTLEIHDREAAIHLYRIAQEAVTNAIKHSSATRIDVQLVANGSDLVLGVHDNGGGLDPGDRSGRGMGLRIMQYRAGAIGGSLAVQRRPTGGTSVVCTVHNAVPRLTGGPAPAPGAAAR